MSPFQMPSLSQVPMTSPVGNGSAFPAEFQMSAPSPESGDKYEALLQRIEDFNNSANQLQTQITMNKQISESEQSSTIIRALEILQSLGVNVSDPQSIAKYLMKLEEENPDMAEIAKKTLYGIFGGQPNAPSEGVSVPPEPVPPVAEEEPQF